MFIFFPSLYSISLFSNFLYVTYTVFHTYPIPQRNHVVFPIFDHESIILADAEQLLYLYIFLSIRYPYMLRIMNNNRNNNPTSNTIILRKLLI